MRQTTHHYRAADGIDGYAPGDLVHCLDDDTWQRVVAEGRGVALEPARYYVRSPNGRLWITALHAGTRAAARREATAIELFNFAAALELGERQPDGTIRPIARASRAPWQWEDVARATRARRPSPQKTHRHQLGGGR